MEKSTGLRMGDWLLPWLFYQSLDSFGQTLYPHRPLPGDEGLDDRAAKVPSRPVGCSLIYSVNTLHIYI